PIHEALRAGGANPVAGVSCAIDMWDAAKEPSREAIANMSFPDDTKTDMVAPLKTEFKRRFDIWRGKYHMAGHLLRPKFLLEASLESVNPFFFLAALESHFEKFYRAEKCPVGISTCEWYSMRFYDDAEDASVLYLPATWLCASRMSGSQSERDFSIAGAASENRLGPRVNKRGLLAHIYWAADCQAGSHAESSESESAESDAGDDGEPGDLEDVKQEFGDMKESIVESPFQKLAKLALNGVKLCINSLRPASEGGPSRGPPAALPLLGTLLDCIVTQRSIGRSGSGPLRVAEACQGHDNKQ
ncbi:unnamed protein product, partial [Prorocentrum cordatum]